MHDANDKVLSDLGEVKGLLRGVTDMIRQSHEATNKRIDDLASSIHRRIDAADVRLRDVSARADEAFELATDTSARVSKHSAVFGGSAGALVGAGIEFIKLWWSHR